LVWLAIALAAAIYVQGQRLSTTNWASPVEVVIFPINGDDSAATARYIASLGDRNFAEVDRFLANQASRYGVPETRPFIVKAGARVEDLPPQPTPKPGDPWYHVALWHLKFRYWAWQHTPDETSNFRRIRVFTVYSQADTAESLPHSLGAQKGLLGLVHAYAGSESEPGNNLVIAHEILHTVGATDKYTAEGYPVFPEGFADAEKKPLFPQLRAEIMAGSLAIDEITSRHPTSLRACVVGTETAREIGWILGG